ARGKLALALGDLQTHQGQVAGERGDPAQAVLWFANAARLAQGHPERESLNRICARTWARQAFTPLHGFQRAGTGSGREQVAFRPGGRHLLVQHWQSGPDGFWGVRGFSVWDLREEQPLPLPAVATSAVCAAWRPDGQWLALGGPEG